MLGAGKVGTAAAVHLAQAGLSIVAVTTRHPATAALAAELTGAEAGTDNVAAAVRARIVLVTTNDDAVAEVAAQVAQAGAFRPGQLVVHMSGALKLSVLEPAARAGADIGCAHPIRSFATREQAIRDIGGAVFGVTAGPGAAGELEALVAALGGRAVEVDDDRKIVYHAAAVMASNYLVAVEDAAVRLLAAAGFDDASATEALAPLARGTLDNVAQMGATAALTGPIVRGDADTVRGHLEALRKLPGDSLELYKALGRHTLEIARRRGTLDASAVERLTELLAE